jgi:hypothetical protein
MFNFEQLAQIEGGIWIFLMSPNLHKIDESTLLLASHGRSQRSCVFCLAELTHQLVTVTFCGLKRPLHDHVHERSLLLADHVVASKSVFLQPDKIGPIKSIPLPFRTVPIATGVNCR